MNDAGLNIVLQITGPAAFCGMLGLAWQLGRLRQQIADHDAAFTETRRSLAEVRNLLHELLRAVGRLEARNGGRQT